jgi:hypothetical protein
MGAWDWELQSMAAVHQQAGGSFSLNPGMPDAFGSLAIIDKQGVSPAWVGGGSNKHLVQMPLGPFTPSTRQSGTSRTIEPHTPGPPFMCDSTA